MLWPKPRRFTYRGELKQNGTSVSGTFDLRFRVYSTLTGGVTFLPETCVNNVAVVDGRFNATVDVPAAFTADARYIRCWFVRIPGWIALSVRASQRSHLGSKSPPRASESCERRDIAASFRWKFQSDIGCECRVGVIASNDLS